MKKLLFGLLLLLISTLVSGQSFLAPDNLNELYEKIPARPAVTTSSVLTFPTSSGGNVTSGSTQFKLLSGSWNIATANALVGVTGTRKIVTNEDAATIVGGNGGGAAQHAFRTLNNSNFFEVWGKDTNTPFITGINGGTAPTSGIQVSGIAAGTTFGVHNVVAYDIGFAPFFANTDGTLSGGNSSTPPTSSNSYTSMVWRYTRAFGLSSEGEGYYLGATTKASYAIIYDSEVSHSFIYNKGRDGLQLNNHVNFQGTNITIYNVGVENVSGQNALLQAQNVRGVLEKSILHTAPTFWDIASQDLVIQDTYFKATARGIIHDYNDSYNSSSRLMVTPVKILFERCYFDSPSSLAYLVDTRERNADIEFKDCVFGPNIQAIYFDNRSVGYTNQLIGTLTTNGNSIAAIPDPIVNMVLLWTSFTEHGLCRVPFFINKGMGFRAL